MRHSDRFKIDEATTVAKFKYQIPPSQEHGLEQWIVFMYNATKRNP